MPHQCSSIKYLEHFSILIFNRFFVVPLNNTCPIHEMLNLPKDGEIEKSDRPRTKLSTF